MKRTQKKAAASVPPWRPIADRVASNLESAALRREIPFSLDLGGACATGSIALHAALATAGHESVFVCGKMVRPEPIDPHIWLEIDGSFVDVTASQAGMMGGVARVVPVTSAAYRVSVRADFYAVDPRDRGAMEAHGPWGHEHAIVQIVAASLDRRPEDVEPFVTRSLWGDAERRDAAAHPLALSASALLCGPRLSAEDLRALSRLVRQLGAGRPADGWGELRSRLLAG